MRVLTTSLCMFLFQLCFAQQRVIDISKDAASLSANSFFVAGGEPFINAKFVNLVEGTPYFKDEWLKGLVVDRSNHQYKDVNLKLDLVESSIHYLDDHQKEYVATTEIKELVLTDTSGNNFRFLHKNNFDNIINARKDNWYLWLSSGAASLYKAFRKVVSENLPYGSATSEQHIRTSETYFISYNNTFFEVRKIKDVPSVLADKKTQLEAFLKEKDNQKASMDDRMIKLIEYYNSLVKEQK